MKKSLGSHLRLTESAILGWAWKDTRGLWLKTFFPLLILSIFLCNCALYNLRKEIAEYQATYGLVGKVVDYSSYKGTVIVVLYSEKDGRKNIVEYTLPEVTGHFSFLVKRGAYYLAAFEDLNGNYVCDENEPAGYFGTPERIVVSSDSKTIIDLDIRLSSSNRFPPGFPTDVGSEEFAGTSFAKFGNITSLDDKMFSPNNGSTGYWKPLTFLKDFGIGVYFTEPYDPDKIPILFVHGAVGTPAGWEAFVAHLDHRHYQPWFYYYPSGLPLESVASVLDYVIHKLHEKYRFNTLYVTAHSMGGLVARAFIMQNAYEDDRDYVKLFISISTPWNGSALAAKGVERSPGVVPSWHDMIPDSEFIQFLFKKKLPARVKFHLFFSFKGNCSLMMGNNDGTVEIASELDYRAQKEAERIYGYDEDHGSILTSPSVIDQFNRILASQERVWWEGMLWGSAPNAK